ncbi:MAG: host attachment protein [Patescibacteria group bacterium]
MLLPESLQHFPDPTLIVIADFGKCKVYKAENIDFDEIASLEADEPPRPDSESSVAVGPGRRTKNDAETDEGEDRKKYAKEIAGAITDKSDDHGIKEIQLIMPAELLRRVQDVLSKDVLNIITKSLDKDLMKNDLMDAMQRLAKIPKKL